MNRIYTTKWSAEFKGSETKGRRLNSQYECKIRRLTLLKHYVLHLQVRSILKKIEEDWKLGKKAAWKQHSIVARNMHQRRPPQQQRRAFIASTPAYTNTDDLPSTNRQSVNAEGLQWSSVQLGVYGLQSSIQTGSKSVANALHRRTSWTPASTAPSASTCSSQALTRAYIQDLRNTLSWLINSIKTYGEAQVSHGTPSDRTDNPASKRCQGGYPAQAGEHCWEEAWGIHLSKWWFFRAAACLRSGYLHRRDARLSVNLALMPKMLYGGVAISAIPTDLEKTFMTV